MLVTMPARPKKSQRPLLRPDTPPFDIRAAHPLPTSERFAPDDCAECFAGQAEARRNFNQMRYGLRELVANVYLAEMGYVLDQLLPPKKVQQRNGTLRRWYLDHRSETVAMLAAFVQGWSNVLPIMTASPAFSDLLHLRLGDIPMTALLLRMHCLMFASDALPPPEQHMCETADGDVGHLSAGTMSELRHRYDVVHAEVVRGEELRLASYKAPDRDDGY
jgi:hypothetical protein